MSVTSIVVSRGGFGPAAGRVLEQIRALQPVTRDELAARTGLSGATVARTVVALTEARLVRERLDLIVPGAIGRPGIPLEIDPSYFVTVGFHLGGRTHTVSLGDLTGRVLASRELVHRPGDPIDVDRLATTAAELIGAQGGVAPVAAGLVAPWRDIGQDADLVADELQELLGLDVARADHIAAVAAAEFIHRRHGTPGVTAYLYVRNTAGCAVAADDGIRTDVSRVSALTHFPIGGDTLCDCGRSGCLIAELGDHAVAMRAFYQGVIEEPAIELVHRASRAGELAARELLSQRARELGRVAATVRDMVDPDRMVLVGQGFTAAPEVLDQVVAAFGAHTHLPPLELSFTRFGVEIQAIAASTVALGPVYDDPLAVVPTPMERQTPRA